MTAALGVVDVRHGDALDVLRTLPDASVDAVVTDPPYALAFMGRKWDRFTSAEFQSWCEKWAVECLRVLKPGGAMLSFGGTRTFHRLACGVEDAGFEMRDSIGYGHAVPVAAWVYGSGYPKSRNALKPAWEPIIVARRPLAGTVAGNVLQHGTGALNIYSCRVGTDVRVNNAGGASSLQRVSRVEQGYRDHVTTSVGVSSEVTGRWPSNVVLSHAATTEGEDACAAGCVEGCPVAELDAQSGVSRSPSTPVKQGGHHRHDVGLSGDTRKGLGVGYADEGGASRFFPVFRYQAKAPTRERPKVGGVAHPTCKPLTLMQWLVRLVCPPGGTVLDPFAGSGTTAEACVAEGFHCITAEREAEYLPLIAARLARVARDGAHGVQVEKPTKEIDGQDDLLSLLGGGAA